MAGKIVIISKNAAFMVNAIETNLRKEGFETVQCAPSIASIDKEKEAASMLLIFGGDFVFEADDVFVYLKDLCAEKEIPLCIAGYAKEIDEVGKTIPERFITRTIERPFDMKALTESVKGVAAADEERRKGKHILLVDDDILFLKMMQEWLSMKYNITIVKSGMQAITYIATHKPDLILLDYDMPITPGPQVMEMIRSEHNAAEIPIIFLTGKSDKESVMSVMALKPQGYLLKSMSQEEIIDAVDHFFETKKWRNVAV